MYEVKESGKNVGQALAFRSTFSFFLGRDRSLVWIF